ncbi:transcription factor bHLH144-like [Juglans microcarpa x Juglans regia]|uniref:transcription factor bHLH144-like n=1 Tax=Juglans microcarpa x Juglans regia TaxID=2249226 RepID=UPI001B7E76C8|nr:transcription factor bHLH144-like [Juglans microcarpa x Juglans regia]XP_041022962.1 transcription factor bHLH144-like [Juglans microcarpa x Juglans regia]XP_041022963.1 transcription factor bHLH144-like [Juglans microcarpa x Juglans regia]XP_041022964.1 transcription factor bHLH144-like [Juglans microcarpa x Juglans regia]XP_041022965.1 transcription factor bHLH144-like [Juglans microcarpa x Juglans regia]XP_041022966.1 transcription factor bHLH144-like [Juglans microcarpa x Juglans regia]
MQGDQHFRAKAVLPLENQVGNCYVHTPVVPAVGAVFNSGAKHLTPFHGVEFQPSEVCPKNFIVFDQTQYRSQIMFHPTIAHKFNAPSIFATSVEDNFEVKEVDFVETETSSPLKEDSGDIDALLSFEEDEQDEYDDEEVSTARTNGDYRCTSPDSFSNYCSNPKKNRSSSMQKASGSGESCNSDRKRQKMKKMVNALRGIVPGGSQMNTVAVLDEAVRYLKSLKVEVQKLGVGDINY